jgi:plasmid stabilization system protein ParE
VKAIIQAGGEEDLEETFNYYQSLRSGLGHEFIDEFRHAVERMLEHPNAWQPLDETYRRCRLHRFPYGVVYRYDAATEDIVIVAVMHLSRQPGWWRNRDR